MQRILQINFFYKKKSTDEVNYSFKSIYSQPATKGFGSWFIWPIKVIKKDSSVELEGLLFKSSRCMYKHEHLHTSV